MIYLRLHQARSEEIEREQAGKFRYRREKISLLQRIFATVAKFFYVAKFPPAAKFPIPFFFLCTNDSVFG